MRDFVSALRFLLVMTALVGVLYPLTVLVVAQGLFKEAAGGSLVRVDGKVVGSRLIGQAWSPDRYFVGRRPAAVDRPYDAGLSGGSNLGPTNPALNSVFDEVADYWRAQGAKSIPVDLFTSSGSGLDPHISPEAAEFQVPFVARARGVSEESLRKIVQENTQGRTLGFLGEPTVNVLELNLALDRLAGLE